MNNKTKATGLAKSSDESSNAALKNDTTEQTTEEKMQSPDNEEQEFTDDLAVDFKKFIKSKKTNLNLKPMNSYFRRLAHKLAAEYDLSSYSEGVGDKRHLVISKEKIAKPTTKPEPALRKERKTTYSSRAASKRNNFGSAPASQSDEREFLLPISDRGLEIILDKDGFVGLRIDQTDEQIVDAKTIKSGAFKIDNGKIIEVF